MRAQGRSPPFLLIGLAVALCILGFNYFSVSSRNSDLANQVSTLQGEVRMLNTKKMSADRRSDETVNRLRNIEIENNRLKSAADEKENEKKALSEKFRANEEEKAACKSDLDKAKSNALKCETDSAGVKEELQKLKEEHDTLKKKLSQQGMPAKCDQIACADHIRNVVAILTKTLGKEAVYAPLKQNNIDVEKFVNSVSPAGQNPGQTQPEADTKKQVGNASSHGAEAGQPGADASKQEQGTKDPNKMTPVAQGPKSSGQDFNVLLQAGQIASVQGHVLPQQGQDLSQKGQGLPSPGQILSLQGQNLSSGQGLPSAREGLAEHQQDFVKPAVAQDHKQGVLPLDLNNPSLQQPRVDEMRQKSDVNPADQMGMDRGMGDNLNRRWMQQKMMEREQLNVGNPHSLSGTENIGNKGVDPSNIDHPHPSDPLDPDDQADEDGPNRDINGVEEGPIRGPGVENKEDMVLDHQDGKSHKVLFPGDGLSVDGAGRENPNTQPVPLRVNSESSPTQYALLASGHEGEGTAHLNPHNEPGPVGGFDPANRVVSFNQVAASQTGQHNPDLTNQVPPPGNQLNLPGVSHAADNLITGDPRKSDYRYDYGKEDDGNGNKEDDLKLGIKGNAGDEKDAKLMFSPERTEIKREEDSIDRMNKNMEKEDKKPYLL